MSRNGTGLVSQKFNGELPTLLRLAHMELRTVRSRRAGLRVAAQLRCALNAELAEADATPFDDLGASLMFDLFAGENLPRDFDLPDDIVQDLIRRLKLNGALCAGTLLCESVRAFAVRWTRHLMRGRKLRGGAYIAEHDPEHNSISTPALRSLVVNDLAIRCVRGTKTMRILRNLQQLGAHREAARLKQLSSRISVNEMLRLEGLIEVEYRHPDDPREVGYTLLPLGLEVLRICG